MSEGEKKSGVFSETFSLLGELGMNLSAFLIVVPLGGIIAGFFIDWLIIDISWTTTFIIAAILWLYTLYALVKGSRDEISEVRDILKAPWWKEGILMLKHIATSGTVLGFLGGALLVLIGVAEPILAALRASTDNAVATFILKFFTGTDVSAANSFAQYGKSLEAWLPWWAKTVIGGFIIYKNYDSFKKSKLGELAGKHLTTEKLKKLSIPGLSKVGKDKTPGKKTEELDLIETLKIVLASEESVLRTLEQLEANKNDPERYAQYLERLQKRLNDVIRNPRISARLHEIIKAKYGEEAELFNGINQLLKEIESYGEY